MSIGHTIALAIIIGLLVTCAHYLRDIRSETRLLTCMTLAENGIKCPALRATPDNKEQS